jgi:hypothetical protein
MSERELRTCPCCGYKTIIEEHDICDVCWWEHVHLEFRLPYCGGGANGDSLHEAQRKFLLERDDPEIVEKASYHERDPTWKPVDDYPWLPAGSPEARQAFANLGFASGRRWFDARIASIGSAPPFQAVVDLARQHGFAVNPSEYVESLDAEWNGSSFTISLDRERLRLGLFSPSRSLIESYGSERFGRFCLALCRVCNVTLGRSGPEYCIGDVTAEESQGVTPVEFIDWLQFWSADIVARWGIDTLKRGPFHRVEELANGAVALWLAADPFDETMSRARTAAYLGITLRRHLVGDHPITGERVHIPWP